MNKWKQWQQLKIILHGAIEAHMVSGNNDRKSEIEWVLQEMKKLENDKR